MEKKEVSKNEITINYDIKKQLLETAQWSKFIAIFCYIGMVFMLCMGLIMFIGVPFMESYLKMVPMYVFGIFYIVMGIIYYFPSTYMYRFAKRMKQGVLTDDEAVLTDGFNNLKKLYRFSGIMIIASLSLSAIILFFTVPAILSAGFA